MSAKKTFMNNNPALQFISVPQIPDDEPKENSDDSESTAAIPFAFPESAKTSPRLAETKSRRVQLLLKPSLFTRLKDSADAKQLSFNDFVNHLLETAVSELM